MDGLQIVNQFCINGNVPDEEPRSNTSAFIPSLIEALAPFITEEARSGDYGWEWRESGWVCANFSSYHITFIFEQVLMLVHMSLSQLYPDMPNLTIEEAKGNLDLICVSSHTPRVVANALRRIDVEEVWNITQRNSRAIGRMFQAIPSRGWIQKSRLWLYHCATHGDARLTSEQKWLLERLLWPKWEMQVIESNLRQQLEQVDRKPDRFFPEFEDAFKILHVIPKEDRHSAIEYIIIQFIRVAMAVADIWETSEAQWPGRAMPPYGSYVRGRQTMMELIEHEVCDVFSNTSVLLRYALGELCVRGAWDFLWYQAKKANENNFTETTLSIYFFNWLLLGLFHTPEHVPSQVKEIAINMYKSEYKFVPHIQSHSRPLRFVPSVLPYASYRVDFEHPGFRFEFRDIAEVVLYGEEFGESIEYFDELEMPDDLEDAELVAVGPPVDIQPLVDEVHIETPEDVCTVCFEGLLGGESQPVVRLKVCGRHFFHYHCIEGLINSGSPVSNLCPIDRKMICPKRPVVPRDQLDAAIDNEEVEAGYDEEDSVCDEDAVIEAIDSP